MTSLGGLEISLALGLQGPIKSQGDLEISLALGRQGPMKSQEDLEISLALELRGPMKSQGDLEIFLALGLQRPMRSQGDLKISLAEDFQLRLRNPDGLQISPAQGLQCRLRNPSGLKISRALGPPLHLTGKCNLQAVKGCGSLVALLLDPRLSKDQLQFLVGPTSLSHAKAQISPLLLMARRRSKVPGLLISYLIELPGDNVRTMEAPRWPAKPQSDRISRPRSRPRLRFSRVLSQPLEPVLSQKIPPETPTTRP